jgi:predicted PhzF superfamily epimerase YddE/YHI9
MSLTIYQVDAFSSRPFAGNPAAVCILPGGREATWMLAVAREMNLSETAFLVRQDDGYHLRWFTPATEVDLCGHATLASAHILWEAGYLKAEEPAHFYTRSGNLTAERQGDWIELDFPATPAGPAPPPPGLLEALGSPVCFSGKTRFDYLLELDSESAVRNLQPDFKMLERVAVRGIIVTSRSDSPEFDFVSRFFAPQSGVNEDPVTGSAHCSLGPYWGEKLGKQEMVAYQVSARGGIVKVRLAGARVKLAGQAVTVLRGELLEQP